MAKTRAVDDAKLADGLRMALDGQVVKATGTAASPGIFGTAAAAAAIYDRARELGYVEPCEGPPAKGKTRPKYCRITDQGRAWVLDRISPRQVLESLVNAVADRRASMAQENSEAQSLKSQVAELKHKHDELLRAIAEAASRRREEAGRFESNLQLVTNSIQGAIKELAHLMSPRAQRPMESPGAATSVPERPPGTLAWLDQVVALVGKQRERDALQPLNLPSIYDEVRRGLPNLTLGEFHDGLRKLREQKRIRLIPFTRALATIDDPRNALYLDGEVMYYAAAP